MTDAARPKASPYAVRCTNHGRVLLTREEFERQIAQPHRLWDCPLCGLIAKWDDVWYAEHTLDDGTPFP